MVLLASRDPAFDVPSGISLAATVIPLVVALDGVVLRTNTLIESIFLLARAKPWSLLKLPAWRVLGRAHLKARLAALALPDIRLLPHNFEVLAFLRAQRQLGRPLVLATAADAHMAQAVGKELELFDRIFASDGHTDLTGERRRDCLVAAYGVRGFDYLGHDACDLPIWRAARRALLMTPSHGLGLKVAAVTPVDTLLLLPPTRWQDHLSALRPLHWVKNGLVFVPLVAVDRLPYVPLLRSAGLAFIAFCLCASGLYLLNDLLDLPADRRHPHKKERMLATGRISLAHAVLMLPVLMAAAFATALALSFAFSVVLATYAILMIAYSLRLKELPLVDVLVLACGYALRVAAGSVATHLRISAWLLVFCIFLFFSLALIKRYAELVVLEIASGTDRVHARGYRGTDKLILVAQGICSGYVAVLVLALYTDRGTAQGLHTHHDFLWGICLLLLYWVSYLWMMATRGRIHDDPVVFAVTDRGSRWTMLAMALLAVLAL